ncbi:MAG: Hsp20/alpha crystallin family protein [Opitutaceae bacterium]|nr:Hsp20/alpha crystallin family protein [Opitutaceae bacterium]
MHSIIHPITTSRIPSTEPSTAFRQPHYDCREQSRAVKIVVYVPGVDAAGVEIVTHGPDLIVTARKARYVRVNWTALHLERAQSDYRLCLRLGHGLDYELLHASLRDGRLTIEVPKRQLVPTAAPCRERRVA